MINVIKLQLLGTIGVGLFAFFFMAAPVSALSGSEFRAGRIIDDPIFTNPSAMSPNEIQAFLNSKLPTCDGSGQQMVYDSSFGDTVSRATYGARRSNPAPFTCLKDYWENPSTKASNYGGQPIPAGAKSAAQLIWEAGQTYNISPKVLLVTLQKEQGLLTDDWPFKRQYTAAMGAYCPDSGPGGSANCDPAYAGFGIQMKEGARLLRYYLDNMDQPWWPYAKPGSRNVLYHPNTGCGSSNVFIESKATAALYTYTPYQPNQAALNNLYGTGDSCSAYGNRNFWRMYHDWFGSPIGCIQIDSQLIYRLHRPSDGDFIYTNNPAEVCFAVAYYGYSIENASMESLAPTDPDARSVFRLSRGGKHLFTIEPVEVNMAMKYYGYVYEGVSFYVSASASTGLYTSYRLSKNDNYILTTSVSERDSFQAAGFALNNMAYHGRSTSSKIPIYRLSKNGLHLYTSNAVEKDLAVTLSGYSYEGIGFYAQSGMTGDSHTVYRMVRGGRYLFTTNFDEKMVALRSSYKQEPSFFYVYPPNYSSTLPVYRLSNPRNGDYLFTTIPAERDTAASQYGYKYEGIGFNAPSP